MAWKLWFPVSIAPPPCQVQVSLLRPGPTCCLGLLYDKKNDLGILLQEVVPDPSAAVFG